MARAKLNGNLEYAALTRYRKFVWWRSGYRKMAKRSFWKRMRKGVKQSANKEVTRESSW